jgi:hypothetical protein
MVFEKFSFVKFRPIKREWFLEDGQGVMKQAIGAFPHFAIAHKNACNLHSPDERLLVPPFGSREPLIELR